MTEQCVLVVDDEEGARESLCELVEMMGCSALVATNGREALELLAVHRPCLIILDLLMPVMSGSELIAALQHEPELAQVPIVISTSAPDRAPPGVPVIAKPIDIGAVWAWMRQTCHCAHAKAATS